MAEAGRPIEYHEELTPKLAQALARQGLNNEEIADGIGIAPSTLYLWQDTYPAFSEALERGKGPVDQRVKNALLRRALGYDLRLRKQVVVGGSLEEAEYDVHIEPDVGAALQWLKNRQPTEWRDKQPEGQGEQSRLNIVISKDTDMSNVELNLGPTKEKTPE